ncbi:hypothetical protein PT974_08567 [Cladobotryum mycophilum]|uniref:Uncharacterized protein n=1 Tax=Cladobotryum mycophilum TaxID=491253 RepID=A0ABR0SES1_9HYPO
MEPILGLDLSRNLSLFTVPAAFIMCMVPNVWAISLAGEAYDVANPRAMKDTVKADSTVEKVISQKITRAKNASDNGFETLGLYAAAVVAANHAGVETQMLNILTLGYILTRILYVYAYVQLGENRNLAPLRSLFWTVGSILTLTLYIKAGLQLAA